VNTSLQHATIASDGINPHERCYALALGLKFPCLLRNRYMAPAAPAQSLSRPVLPFPLAAHAS
jgi:hypothetical protein